MNSAVSSSGETSEPPRSKVFIDKTIKAQGYATVKGTRYYKRVFFDGCMELVRYDAQANKWAVLCFTT
ncbi:MAG: hypothetical protein FWE74_11160 [Oscillospiraceae bacterium]|nr:hypothetical protein [Oscillospiraceae bacterium]